MKIGDIVYIAQTAVPHATERDWRGMVCEVTGREYGGSLMVRPFAEPQKRLHPQAGDVRPLEKGTQIVHVPAEAAGDPSHPSCEEGFVTAASAIWGNAFCRYWRQGENELRTKLNGEATDLADLIVKETRPQRIIAQAMEEWCS